MFNSYAWGCYIDIVHFDIRLSNVFINLLILWNGSMDEICYMLSHYDHVLPLSDILTMETCGKILHMGNVFHLVSPEHKKNVHYHALILD